jgi:hypothetical protein
MRRAILLTCLLLATPAAAQHWNDAPPGRDLLSAVPADFDGFRQRMAAQPAPPTQERGAALDPLGQPRGPIPILDWVQPGGPQAAAAPRRTSSAPRRVVRRAPRTEESVSYSAAPAPRAATGTSAQDWERRLAERERELDRLRAQLDADRLRLQQSQQPTLR